MKIVGKPLRKAVTCEHMQKSVSLKSQIDQFVLISYRFYYCVKYMTKVFIYQKKF